MPLVASGSRCAGGAPRTSGASKSASVREPLCVAALAFLLVTIGGRAALAQQGACVIKGNISDKGERIYHVPGDEFYSRTVITPSRGERWFCSEAEAVKAGWRKSKR